MHAKWYRAMNCAPTSPKRQRGSTAFSSLALRASIKHSSFALSGRGLNWLLLMACCCALLALWGAGPAPVQGPLVDDLLKSAEAFRRDPKRLAAWARQLSDPSENVRAAATVSLLRAREAAVAPLVDILADSKRAAEHAVARQILVQLDD